MHAPETPALLLFVERAAFLTTLKWYWEGVPHHNIFEGPAMRVSMAMALPLFQSIAHSTRTVSPPRDEELVLRDLASGLDARKASHFCVVLWHP
eukprot:481556-Amphidinium_carterae.1